MNRSSSSGSSASSTTDIQTQVKLHPMRRFARRYLIGGGFIFAFGIFLALVALQPSILLMCALMSALGAFLFWNGHVLYGLGASAPYLNGAVGSLARGDLEGAESLHAQMPARLAKRTAIGRVLHVQRALIALARGDADAAIEQASPATTQRSELFTAGWDGIHRGEAFAIRALARAAKGEGSESVEADAREVESSPLARSSAFARIGLARAVVLARKGDKPALGAHLAKNGNLILEYSMPRERALYRAMRALARSPGKSVYREPARPDEDAAAADASPQANEKRRLRSWISQVAPDAAEFASDGAAASDGGEDATAEPAQVDPQAMNAIALSRRNAAKGVPANKSRWKRALALWVVLVVMFLSIWQFLTPSSVSPGPDPDPVADEAVQSASLWVTVASPVVMLAAAVLLIGFVIVRYRRQERMLVSAERELAFDNRVAGKAMLMQLTKVRNSILKAGAHMQLATLANRDGEFANAIQEADRGIAIIGANPSAQALSSDQYTPGLIAERAFALAALGHFAEAETEIATMTMAYPSYAFLTRALFRVRLMTAVRSGNVQAAARLAMSRTPDLPIDLRTDLLADVMLAESGEPLSAGDRDRITAELADMPAVAAWITNLRKFPLVFRVAAGTPAAAAQEQQPPPAPAHSEDYDYDYVDDEHELSPARARRAAQRKK